MFHLLQTPEGQAISNAVANALSLLAIVIAVIVALVEQRRANAERGREQVRERLAIERAERDRVERRKAVVEASLSLVDKAIFLMTNQLPDVGEMYTQWEADRGKPLQLASIESSLLAVRSAASDEVQLILLLSTAAAIVHGTVHPRLTDGAPSVNVVLRILKEQAQQLRRVRNSMADLIQSIPAAEE